MATNGEVFPTAGEDEIHPETEMQLVIFGQGKERINFPPEQATLRVRRSEPYETRGLKAIDTEITSLELNGESELLGRMTLRGGSDQVKDDERRIYGRIVELEPGQRFPAENWFDVYIEIETEHGTFRNRKPEHMVAEITDIPPDFNKTPYRATTEINLYRIDAAEDEAPVGAIGDLQHKSSK
jgi:hypothetical protein